MNQMCCLLCVCHSCLCTYWCVLETLHNHHLAYGQTAGVMATHCYTTGCRDTRCHVTCRPPSCRPSRFLLITYSTDQWCNRLHLLWLLWYSTSSTDNHTLFG